MTEADKVDLNAYCVKEREQATAAKELLVKTMEWYFLGDTPFLY